MYNFSYFKSILLAALARAEGIPSRLSLADVRNHLSTKRHRELMQTDVFVYHGYTELFPENKWIKATTAFNLSLCERFGVKPLEFDGRNDSILHEFDPVQRDNRHMEYLRDHGQFVDLPFRQMVAVFKKHYPALYSEDSSNFGGDFEEKALAITNPQIESSYTR